MGSFLMWGGAPWVLALAVLGVAAALWFVGGRLQGVGRWGLRAPALLAAFLGLSMVGGAVFSAAQLAAAHKAYPLTGEIVKIEGGAALHLTCEGPRDTIPVVWLSGGYGQGLWMKPLHDRVKAARRSCIIDRPGTGQAPAGQLPRTVERVVDEVHAALAASGETTPYVVAGHSFGGLYAVNLAAAYPDSVASVIQLDPTPPGWFVEQVGAFGCGSPSGDPIQVVGAMYGLGYVPALNPLLGPQVQPIRDAIGADWPALLAWELRPASLVSQASALHAPCADPFSVVRTPGVLGDTPLLTIVQMRDPDWKKWAPPGLSTRGLKNWERWADYQRTEYQRMSANARLIEAPAGATHYFPLLDPAFTLAEIDAFLASVEKASAATAAPAP